MPASSDARQASHEVQDGELLVEDCSKTFVAPGREVVKALNGISFRVPKGSLVAIVGSNGAGKSTLLSLIAGNTLPDRGRIVVSGKDLTSLPSWRRVGLISRVQQDPQRNMVSTLTIEENFTLALAGKRGRFGLRRTSSSKVRELAAELLKPLKMGLEDRLSEVSGSLSGGQRQAVAVAMASLGDPAVVLLDEHVAALDPHSAQKVSDVTEQLVRANGITALMVTHDMTHALRYADRLFMMHRGRAVLDLEGEQLKGVTVSDLQAQFAELAGGSLSDTTLLSTQEG